MLKEKLLEDLKESMKEKIQLEKMLFNGKSCNITSRKR